jgi:hypothetical protein
MQKEPTHIQAHLVFAEKLANTKNQKSLNFCQPLKMNTTYGNINN